MRAIIFSLTILITLNMNAQNIYEYIVKDINGKDFDFSALKGKKMMIVNTASKCGLTPQYKKLQELFEKYQDKNFVIIGFPSNDFMGQEPGDEAQIKSFCSTKYQISFPMMSKVVVKKKTGQAPIYQYLTQKEKNGVQDSKISWNFQKYLIDESGTLVKMISPRTSPDTEEIITWIEN